MDVEFKNDNCKKLYTDSIYTCGLDQHVIRNYRMCLQAILAASNINDLVQTRFLNIKQKDGESYFLLNSDKYQLVIEFIKDDCVNVIDIAKLDS